MVTSIDDAFKPKVSPDLHPDFVPAVLWNAMFRQAATPTAGAVPLVIGLERADGSVSRFETATFPASHHLFETGLRYADRLVKSLLWMRGGYKVIVGGPEEVAGYLRRAYAKKGSRAFDADLMATAYDRRFVVEVTTADGAPAAHERARPLGRHLEGCRIGFDLGASDRKVSAVVEGETVFSEEVPWDPRNQTNPVYHYHQVMSGLHQAASRLPRVDAIGGSAAGIYIDNKAMVASLFRGIPRPAFRKDIKPMFLRMQKAWKVPFEVVNDGEVTALAGSMSLNANRVLGIALGSSQAGGYVNDKGNITGWLNELAFAPVDYQPDAPVDEWSGDAGCGVQYFSQECVVRLAPAAGIEFEAGLKSPEKLEVVQQLMADGDPRPGPIYESIGIYLGYALAHYADFYDLEHVLILGRVTSGEGGNIILARANEVLQQEFPDLAARIELHTPDEKSRRVGQAIAAASLPEMG
jgi:predicted NBD/HSP70 family sugar kinase